MTTSRPDPIALARHLLGEGAYAARPFGAGKFSDVYAVTETASGRDYVLRIAPADDLRQLFYERRMMRQEPALHERLARETSVPVPPILAHDFSRRVIDRDFLIMPRLPGRPLNEAGLSPAAARRAHREWGGYVRQIHAVTDPEHRFGYLGAHHCMAPRDNWPDAFRDMYARLLDDVVDCGVYDRHLAELALARLDAHRDAFEPLDASHLCHGDLWGTNLLVEDTGAVTGVLDFDRACWGDPEWDLAIADYCGVTTPDFWEGYGRAWLRDRGAAAVRRKFYLLYEHQKYIVIAVSARHNDPARARRYAEESLRMMEAI